MKINKFSCESGELRKLQVIQHRFFFTPLEHRKDYYNVHPIILKTELMYTRVEKKRQFV